jgi:ABC-type nitrate/sulfonate/bicarbonate transport system ATPase subunit
VTTLGCLVGPRPAAMSGGMRRRLTLARACAMGRPLLLLD